MTAAKQARTQPLELIAPTVNLEQAYSDYVWDFRAAGEQLHNEFAWMPGTSFADFVQRNHDWAAGRNLPDGFVPMSQHWLVQGGRILGMAQLRYALTRTLADYGGHIGYHVRPCERGKGVGTRLLREVLSRARHWALAACS